MVFSLLFLLFLVIPMATTIWMTFDAKTHQIPIDKKPYGLNNGALAWFLTGILLWIVTFPYYLWKRDAALRQRQPAKPNVAPIASPHADGREN